MARLKLLANNTRAVVRELMAFLQVEQSLLSHHLRILRDAQIVTAERDCKSMFYRLAGDVDAKAGTHRTRPGLLQALVRLAGHAAN